jgi:hypothetical protein
MKRIVQLLLFVSSATAAVGLWQFGRIWVGYSIGEAFNTSGLIRSPENFGAERGLKIWGLYVLMAVGVTLVLTVTYRRNYRGRSRDSTGAGSLPTASVRRKI